MVAPHKSTEISSNNIFLIKISCVEHAGYLSPCTNPGNVQRKKSFVRQQENNRIFEDLQRGQINDVAGVVKDLVAGGKQV